MRRPLTACCCAVALLAGAAAVPADVGGWSVRSGENFAWASAAAAWGIDGPVASSVAWTLTDLREGKYRLFIGGYRAGRIVLVSVSDRTFVLAFADDGNSSPSKISGGMEFSAGEVQVREGKLVIAVLHPPTPGVSYLDYFRLVPDAGGEEILVEAETIAPEEQPMPVTKTEPPSEAAAREAIETIHQLLWGRFVDPDTHLLYTVIPEGGFGPQRPGGIEDTSLCGGMYLDAMILRHEATRDPGDAEKARLICQGLLDNATVAGVPGYILRGFQPDRKTLNRDPSVDQYTGLLFGLWRYWRSELPGEQERAAIRQVFTDVMERLEGRDWQIREPDGTLTTFGHLDAQMPTRAERLLSFLLMAHEVSGDGRWQAQYEALLPSRLPRCVGFPAATLSWVALQSQLSLRALLELEPDWSRRELYRRGMRECAEVSWGQVPEGVPGGADREALSRTLASSSAAYSLLRVPLDAISAVLLSDNRPLAKQAADRLKVLAVFYDYSYCLDSRALAPVEWNYWLAVSQGLMRLP